MKKKGFTLIELLAVIVVLAIIALIATPIVMNLIKNAGKGAAERSAERYLKAVETMIASERAKDGTIVEDGTYTIGDGKISKDGKEYTIEVTGDYPKEGSVVIANGQVVSGGTSMKIGEYTVTVDTKGKATAKIVVILCNAIAPSAQNVYDITTQEITSKIVGVQATQSAPYAYGAVYSCELGDGVSRTFYVYKEDGDNIKLLMNENIGSETEWITQDRYYMETCGIGSWSRYELRMYCGPLTALEQLETPKSTWTKLFAEGGSVALPSAQDIFTASGLSNWGSYRYNSFYNGESTSGTAEWARTNLNMSTPSAYWTDTEDEMGIDPYAVTYNGNIKISTIDSKTGKSVRPAITVPKTKLSL